MRILLTGGSGYIGSVTAEELLGRGYRVTIYDNLSTGHRAAVPDGADFIFGDLSEKEKLITLLQEKKIDAVIHFAASSIVSESVNNPSKYYNNNVVNGLSLLDAMITAGVGRIIFSSTAAVYGDPANLPISEESPTKPTSPYGDSKLIFERILESYSRAYPVSYISLRYFNAAGASHNYGEDHRSETHLIPLILKTALKKYDKITVYGQDYPTSDGSCIRDYIHVKDLAKAHILALEAAHIKNAIYNLGNGEGYSVLQVIQAAQRITGKIIAIETSSRRKGDPPILLASATKIMRELNWQPEFKTIDSIIESAWDWHCRFPDGYVNNGKSRDY